MDITTNTKVLSVLLYRGGASGRVRIMSFDDLSGRVVVPPLESRLEFAAALRVRILQDLFQGDEVVCKCVEGIPQNFRLPPQAQFFDFVRLECVGHDEDGCARLNGWLLLPSAEKVMRNVTSSCQYFLMSFHCVFNAPLIPVNEQR